MKKFLKNVVVLGVLAAGGYCVYKFVMRLKQTIKLDKSLPLFLKNTIGEQPAIQINLQFRSLTIILKFSAETLARETDIEQFVREYIEDFYPVLSQMSLTVRLEEKPEEKELNLEPEETEEPQETHEPDEVEESETEESDS